MATDIRRIPKTEREQIDVAEESNCVNISAIAEVERLTREVHTATHLLSGITKRLFELKEKLKAA